MAQRPKPAPPSASLPLFSAPAPAPVPPATGERPSDRLYGHLWGDEQDPPRPTRRPRVLVSADYGSRPLPAASAETLRFLPWLQVSPERADRIIELVALGTVIAFAGAWMCGVRP